MKLVLLFIIYLLLALLLPARAETIGVYDNAYADFPFVPTKAGTNGRKWIATEATLLARW